MVCGCVCVWVYTDIVGNELICGYANVVHTWSSFRPHTLSHTIWGPWTDGAKSGHCPLHMQSPFHHQSPCSPTTTGVRPAHNKRNNMHNAFNTSQRRVILYVFDFLQLKDESKFSYVLFSSLVFRYVHECPKPAHPTFTKENQNIQFCLMCW